MKKNIHLLTGIILLTAIGCSRENLFDQTAGNLHLVIDQKGQVTTLENTDGQVDYIASNEASYLLECKRYGPDSIAAILPPQTMKILNQDQSETRIRLAYPAGLELTVLITNKKDYFRMELVDARPADEIDQITWGPVRTSMKGAIGEWIGLNRSNDFTIGLLSLEPNTDGIAYHYSPISAAYTPEGSLMQLVSYDHTRDRFVPFKKDGHEDLRRSNPIPGATVIGSAVALFGCPAGQESELDLIEKIELAENLPHPVFEGLWNKRSIEGKKFCIWAGYDENSFEDYLKLSKEMGARILCRPGGFFKNWGHFEISPKIYPGGIQAILEDSRQAKKEGIGLTLYTLTTFLTPISEPEPYLTPVPDDRLQTWRPMALLVEDLSPGSKELKLHKTDEVLAVLNTAPNKVLRIDDEFIEFKEFHVEGDQILAQNCVRGAFSTLPAGHPGGVDVKLMYVAGYHNFYPGTIDLSMEFSGRLFDILLEADLDNFVTDGFESCMEAGYGTYTGNMFLKSFYDKCVQNNKEILATTSNLSQYTWHFFSHIAWGEGDTERGFRGTMLDYRLNRQIQLGRNLMPKKLGQYYPKDVTLEDIHWIMGLATGWDSGLDFHLELSVLKNNPDYEKIVDALRLWDQARSDKAFTEEQKMALRQTDVLYKLSRKPDGGWDLKFERFWQNEKIHILPSPAMNARPVSGGGESVGPGSIDWFWTHNPGLYSEVCLSDDLVHKSGTSKTQWTIDYPAYTESAKSWYPTSDRHFQFVLRLPDDAPCDVQNFRVYINDDLVEIPATLKPGQYLSIPHLIEVAMIYNEKHQVIREVNLHGYLPTIKKGSTATVGLSCEPVDSNTLPEVILNVRYQNGYFYQ